MTRGYLEAMRATFDFSGRASRATFWSFVFVAIVLGLLARSADAALHTGQLINGIVGLIHAVPSLSVQVRRLHDRGRSGWWLLLTLTLVGVIPLLVWLCRRGDPGPNRFGNGGTSTASPESLPSVPGVSPVLPAKRRSTPAKVGRGILLVLGLVVGVLGIAHVNGFRFSNAPSCSAAEVTSLVQKLVREDLEKGSLSALIMPGQTRVDLQAIRTRSSSGSISECAAHVSLGIALKQAFVTASPDDALRMKSRSEFDAEYRAQLTDDQQHIYVSMQNID